MEKSKTQAKQTKPQQQQKRRPRGGRGVGKARRGVSGVSLLPTDGGNSRPSCLVRVRDVPAALLPRGSSRWWRLLKGETLGTGMRGGRSLLNTATRTFVTRVPGQSGPVPGS